MIITLIMEAVSISETPVTFYKTAWHSIKNTTIMLLLWSFVLKTKRNFYSQGLGVLNVFNSVDWMPLIQGRGLLNTVTELRVL
jgi:hypothetical protein